MQTIATLKKKTVIDFKVQTFSYDRNREKVK